LSTDRTALVTKSLEDSVTKVARKLNIVEGLAGGFGVVGSDRCHA
jgi:hypothetical protein